MKQIIEKIVCWAFTVTVWLFMLGIAFLFCRCAFEDSRESGFGVPISLLAGLLALLFEVWLIYFMGWLIRSREMDNAMLRRSVPLSEREPIRRRPRKLLGGTSASAPKNPLTLTDKAFEAALSDCERAANSPDLAVIVGKMTLRHVCSFARYHYESGKVVHRTLSDQ